MITVVKMMITLKIELLFFDMIQCISFYEDMCGIKEMKKIMLNCATHHGTIAQVSAEHS